MNARQGIYATRPMQTSEKADQKDQKKSKGA